jgi:hypothetical protein
MLVTQQSVENEEKERRKSRALVGRTPTPLFFLSALSPKSLLLSFEFY